MVAVAERNPPASSVDPAWKDTAIVLGAPIVVALLLCIGALVALARAWAFAKMWHWLAVPQFGVRPLAVTQVFAGMLLWEFARYRYSDAPPPKLWKVISGTLGHLGLSLLVAYCVKSVIASGWL